VSSQTELAGRPAWTPKDAASGMPDGARHCHRGIDATLSKLGALVPKDRMREAPGPWKGLR
jgi:hypothetical protein